ncbi:MAG TPA: glycosyltransferase family 39 protein [Anaerolineae bacterium]
MRVSAPPQHSSLILGRLLTAPLILALAALLRFYNLSGQSLWADEGNSVALARRGFVEIAQRTAFDIHPPFYYWLLKLWIVVFGDSEIGLRSLSVVLGIGLVYLIGVLGTRFFGPGVGLTAAFIAAVSPLQIYYSQEARMYMLLTVLSTLTVLVAFDMLPGYAGPGYAGGQTKRSTGLMYVLIATAGLYTHYAYPLILVAIDLSALFWFWRTRRTNHSPATLFTWFGLQLIPLLLYLPWLPIAWRQVTTWPADRQVGSLPSILNEISTTLLFGLSWPFDMALVPTIGLGLTLLISLWLTLTKAGPGKTDQPDSRFTVHSLLLWLWLLLPILLTAIIFSPAFLKFLLVATPPLALFLALVSRWFVLTLERFVSGRSTGRPGWPAYLVGGGLLMVLSAESALSLYHYYGNSAYARDNYRGIAYFIKALAGPNDAVVLNAEGQQDVFNYYYERDSAAAAAPVYALPRQRPLNEATTLTELQEITHQAGKIYAVYWATDQADPGGLIEGWFNDHFFKATDQWFGNVRLVSYASPPGSTIHPKPTTYRLGEPIRLTGYTLSTSQITPGDILTLSLSWQTDTPLAENYIVFTQLLDPANHLVGQRDAPPRLATSAWPVGQTVADGHGIFVEPGSPPGPHRLIVGLYDGATGRRLPVKTGAESNEEQVRDFIELNQVEIVRPATALPLDAFNIQVPLNTQMLDVVLLGYDLYKAGHRSTPAEPLHPGDPLHLVAYWTPRRPVQWLEDQLFIQVVSAGGHSTPLFVTRHPSGTDYSIKAWQPGEIVRAQYDLFLTGVEPGTYRLALTLGVVQTSTRQVSAVTKPFRVEPLPILAPAGHDN